VPNQAIPSFAPHTGPRTATPCNSGGDETARGSVRRAARHEVAPAGCRPRSHAVRQPAANFPLSLVCPTDHHKGRTKTSR